MRVTSQLLAAALQYASLGLPVFPLHHIQNGKCTCRAKTDCSAGKHPLADCAPNGVLNATTDVPTITAWWTKHPHANIGLRLAQAPSDPDCTLIAIDVDDGERIRRDGTRVIKKGSEQLLALEALHEELLTPLVQQTGGGGRHLLFKVPLGVSLPGKLAKDIEIKGLNSYIVVAPSNHESGRPYMWETPLQSLAVMLDVVPLAPSWIYDQTSRQGPDDPDAGFNYFDDQPIDIPQDVFISAVRAVPNDKQFDNRSDWVIIGAAIHHQSRGEPWGLELFHEFSAGWDGGYDQEHTDATWASFKLNRSSRNVTARYIIKLAQAAGWSMPIDTNLPIGDLTAGRAFAERYRGKYLYVSAEKQWHMCVDGHWKQCVLSEEVEAAKAVAEIIFADALAQYGKTHSAQHLAALRQANELVRNQARLRAMTQMAASEPGMAVAARDSFDKDPLLLAVANGVLDLRLMKLDFAQPEMRLSRRAAVAYDRNAKCPMFEKALDEIFPGDPDSILLFQQMVGYCLTGLKTDDTFLFKYGAGANGKSMLSHIWEAMMGSYCTTISAEALEKSREGNEGRYDLAELPGSRLILAKETSAGGVFDDRFLKILASNDTVRARAIYGKPFNFKPTGKLVIHGNHKPGVTDASEGFWRRMKLLTFSRTFLPHERDATLAARIIDRELPGYLNWAIDGYISWSEKGFAVTEKMENEQQQYREDTDHLAEWLEDFTVQVESGRTHRRKAYSSYRDFCAECGLEPPSDRLFYRNVEVKGFTQLKSSGRFFVGFVMKDSQHNEKFDADGVDPSGLV